MSEMNQRKPPRAGLLLWMCVMNLCLDSAAAAASSTLSITHCEIMLYSNITCYWETTDHHLNDNSYRLQINITNCDGIEKENTHVGDCDTRGSYCAVKLNSAFHCFCADVLASTRTGSIRSPLYFFKGRNSVKLPPPRIKCLKPSERRSGCLQVDWGTTDSLLKDERDHLQLQMEYTTHDQTRSQTIQAFSNDETLELCDLHPGSKYTVRLRAQDRRAHTHWSSWTSTDITTEEKAPSAAPQLWRNIQPAEEAGKRRLTLLWKPVSWPEVNGVVLSYSASCHSELDSWTCGALNASRNSCVLVVSVDPCNCSLTATNSAGTSPPAHIYIPAHTDAEELPPPQTFNVTPLDDTRLKVEWTAALNQSVSGFVLQWSSVPYNGPTSLHWEHMSKTARSFILTGLLPEVPYNLTIMSLYGHRAGSDMSVIAFTQEGAPSVGPKTTVLKTSSSGVVLKWEPVPIEKLHGFIQHYTVLYSINGKSEEVHTHVEQISLRGLTTGTYNICVIAHTAAGGAAGPWQMVAVGLEDVQVIPILLCALLLSFFILIIPLCLRVRIKQCLCPTVPDPSKSSLSVWSNTNPCQHTLTSTMSSIISISQATSYEVYGEKDYIQVQVFPYHSVRQDDNETNGTSTGTYLDPKLEPAQASPTHLFNQSYDKPDQVIPAGYKEDSHPSSADLLLDSLLSYKRNQVDLSSYSHVSQSYVPFVTTVDAYRTLELDECSHFLQVLPEATGTQFTTA